jgi:hypothetical protein
MPDHFIGSYHGSVAGPDLVKTVVKPVMTSSAQLDVGRPYDSSARHRG